MSCVIDLKVQVAVISPVFNHALICVCTLNEQGNASFGVASLLLVC